MLRRETGQEPTATFFRRHTRVQTPANTAQNCLPLAQNARASAASYGASCVRQACQAVVRYQSAQWQNRAGVMTVSLPYTMPAGRCMTPVPSAYDFT